MRSRPYVISTETGSSTWPPACWKVRELRDLHAVEPHFPTETPCTQRGRFPVVFDKANVVLFAFDAEREQGFQINLLRITGIGLEDDLKLRVLLQPIGIVAIAAIVGADGRLDVGHVPWLRPQHAQGGGGIHRARADLMIVGLPQRAAAAGPVILQRENDLLKRECRTW